MTTSSITAACGLLDVWPHPTVTLYRATMWGQESRNHNTNLTRYSHCPRWRWYHSMGDSATYNILSLLLSTTFLLIIIPGSKMWEIAFSSVFYVILYIFTSFVGQNKHFEHVDLNATHTEDTLRSIVTWYDVTWRVNCLLYHTQGHTDRRRSHIRGPRSAKSRSNSGALKRVNLQGCASICCWGKKKQCGCFNARQSLQLKATCGVSHFSTDLLVAVTCQESQQCASKGSEKERC